MKLFGCLVIGKDGGVDSNVDGVMFEIKSLFSVGILRFKNGSREAFHSHAFNCVSWLLYGKLREVFLDPCRAMQTHFRGAFIRTGREDVHKVFSLGTSYVLTFRGPWKKTWVDVEERTDQVGPYWDVQTLTHGRVMSTAKFFETRQGAAAFARKEAAR